MKKVLIDYIKNIELDLDNPPITNIQALDYLKEGIFHLAGVVESKEIRNASPESSEKNNCFIPGKSTKYYWSNSSSDNDLILSQFNWFAISCINYIRTIGLVDIMIQKGWKTLDIKNNIDEIKQYCSNYAEEVVPELLKWRNKISAHPSITDSRSKDNLGLLEFSLMNQLTFTYPHYYVGGFNWIVDGEKSELEPWSLVEVFTKRLIPRYWPDIKRNIN